MRLTSSGVCLTISMSSVMAHGATHRTKQAAWYELTNGQIQMLGWAGITVGVILLCVSLYLYTQIDE